MKITAEIVLRCAYAYAVGTLIEVLAVRYGRPAEQVRQAVIVIGRYKSSIRTWHAFSRFSLALRVLSAMFCSSFCPSLELTRFSIFL